MDSTTALHDAARAVEKIIEDLIVDQSVAGRRAVLLLHAVAIALRKAGDATERPRFA